MMVSMRFLEMFLTIMLMVRRMRMSMGMGVGFRVTCLGRRKSRPCKIGMHVRMISTRMVVVERPDLRQPEGGQEESQQDDNPSPESALPCSLDCHAVRLYFSPLLLFAPYEIT